MKTNPANPFLEVATLIDERSLDGTSPLVHLDLDRERESFIEAATIIETIETIETVDVVGETGETGETVETGETGETVETLAPQGGPPPIPPPRRFIEPATIQERLDDEAALVSRLERDPHDPVAGESLEALYARRGD